MFSFSFDDSCDDKELRENHIYINCEDKKRRKWCIIPFCIPSKIKRGKGRGIILFCIYSRIRRGKGGGIILFYIYSEDKEGEGWRYNPILYL